MVAVVVVLSQRLQGEETAENGQIVSQTTVRRPHPDLTDTARDAAIVPNSISTRSDVDGVAAVCCFAFDFLENEDCGPAALSRAKSTQDLRFEMGIWVHHKDIFYSYSSM